MGFISGLKRGFREMMVLDGGRRFEWGGGWRDWEMEKRMDIWDWLKRMNIWVGMERYLVDGGYEVEGG